MASPLALVYSTAVFPVGSNSMITFEETADVLSAAVPLKWHTDTLAPDVSGLVELIVKPVNWLIWAVVTSAQTWSGLRAPPAAAGAAVVVAAAGSPAGPTTVGWRARPRRTRPR